MHNMHLSTKVSLLGKFIGTKNSKALFEKYDSLTEIAKMSDEEIRLIAKNITTRQMEQFRSLIQINLILNEEKAAPANIIRSHQDVVENFRESFEFAANEEFWVLFMDDTYRVIGKEKVAEGNIDHVAVSAREILAAATRRRASVIAVAHNHPNGTSFPSSNDTNLTNHLTCVANALRIRLHDHIIFGQPEQRNNKDYYSYREEDNMLKSGPPVQY